MEVKRLILFTLLMTSIVIGAFYYWGNRDLLVEMEGRIHDVTLTDAGGVVLHVVEDRPMGETLYFGEAMVYVDNFTSVWTSEGQVRFHTALFTLGQMVELETTGMVRESFPVQVDARKIRILP